MEEQTTEEITSQEVTDTINEMNPEEINDTFEGQDIPTVDETSTQEGHENNLEVYPEEAKDDFDIPLTEDGEYDFDNMTESQIESLLEKLDAEIEDEPEEEGFQLPEKFKDVESLVKSYQMLESKVGNFKGAPEEYSIEGVDMNSEVMQELSKTAKELNMSNEAFSKFVTKHQEVQEQMNEINMSKEMDALGPNAETRIANINSYLDNNLAPDIAEAIRGMATSSESVRAIEALIANARPSGPAMAPTQAPAPQDINALLNEKDAYGGLRMETDSAFHDKVMALMQQQWG